MMHEDAKTCFILNQITHDILVSFSIRQGDPLSMALYIIYIEPLLLYLENHLTGLKIADFHQVTEAFCDDVNVLTEDMQDLPKVDAIITKFEEFSGAILSRNNKCKLMGLGSWKSKTVWPLTYAKTEDELKIFGIFVRNSYRAMAKKNWDFRFQKFTKCVNTWMSRKLPSLLSKVEILKVFALTRVYYLASILPISKTMIQKFESFLARFIWKGWLLRVALDEVKNVVKKGGLNMVCLQSMCNSMLLSQLLRLMKSSYAKSVSHIGYWIGDSLGDLLPGIDEGHMLTPYLNILLHWRIF